VTSRTNARELERLQAARGQAHHRFARQLTLLTQIESTAAELEQLTARCDAQLAALAQLAGGPGPAADLCGLPRARLDAAARAADRTAVDAALAAAVPTSRRRRSPSHATGAASPTPGGSGS
jgi:hypothetical protein